MDRRITWKVLAFQMCDECKEAGVKRDYPEDQDTYLLVHTDGFKDIGHPEIATVLNIEPKITTTIFNHIGLEITEGKRRFDVPGEYEKVIGNGYKVKIVKYDNDDMLYMFFPDVNGKFPGDDGCEIGFCSQEDYARATSKIRVKNKSIMNSMMDY